MQIKEDIQIDSRKVKDETKKQLFDKDKRATTDTDDQAKNPAEVTQQIKDMFMTEELDEIFGTAQDKQIIEEDIPERLQIKLGSRFNPSDAELEREAEWIFQHIDIKTFELSKDPSFASKI